MIAAVSVPWAAIGPIVGVLIAPAGAWFVTRRTHSGRIRTSDAATLWDEAEKMREAYREETVSLRAEAVALRSEVLQLREEMLQLRGETARLRSEAKQWRETAEALRAQLAGPKGGA